MNIQTPLYNLSIAVEIDIEMENAVKKMIAKSPTGMPAQSKYELQLMFLRKTKKHYKQAVKNHRTTTGRYYYEVRIAVINEMIEVYT